MGRVPETVLSPFLQAASGGGMRACRPTHSLYVIRRAGCPHPAAGRHPLYCQPVGGGVPDAPHPLPAKKFTKFPKYPPRVTTLQHPGCRIGANQAQKGALRMKKVALLLAAAMLALAGCASAGDTAAASEAALAESTAESAAAEDSTEAALPGEPYPSRPIAPAQSAAAASTRRSPIFQAARTVSAALITAPSTKPTLPPGRPMRCTARTPSLRPRR